MHSVVRVIDYSNNLLYQIAVGATGAEVQPLYITCVRTVEVRRFEPFESTAEVLRLSVTENRFLGTRI